MPDEFGVDAGVAQLAPQDVDVRAKVRHRGRRRPVPQPGQEFVGGQRFGRPEEEQAEQSLDLGALERHLPVTSHDPERTKDLELHRAPKRPRLSLPIALADPGTRNDPDSG
jgi:hypothetical protein